MQASGRNQGGAKIGIHPLAVPAITITTVSSPDFTMYITDARRFLDDKGAIGPQRGAAKAMAEFHASAIAYASDFDDAGLVAPTCFKCKKMPVQPVIAQDDAIYWSCPRCKAEGQSPTGKAPCGISASVTGLKAEGGGRHSHGTVLPEVPHRPRRHARSLGQHDVRPDAARPAQLLPTRLREAACAHGRRDR